MTNIYKKQSCLFSEEKKPFKIVLSHLVTSCFINVVKLHVVYDNYFRCLIRQEVGGVKNIKLHHLSFFFFFFA